MLSRKSEILYLEAIKDIEVGNYNKAVSALYFSVRREIEAILVRMRLKDLPKRDDKLANVLKHLGFPEGAEDLMRLYEMRKKADYEESLINYEEAKEALRIVNKIFKALQELS
ncbi:MAG: HEPN domain-containing protein [Candidatus Methanomethylicia archaeon]|uniref:HEPN domain-containing protein n=1 Tax=Saccharolobus sp. TaxID=2100761 RepID=UPI003167E0BF